MGLFAAIKGFLQLSNVHGFKYLADKDVPWIGKLFWLICIVLCWFASIVLMISSLDQYENNSISFVADTVYVDWNNNFPAVFVCETENGLTDAYTEELWGENAGLYISDIFNEIAFFEGSATIMKDRCHEEENAAACNMDYKLIASKLRHNCTSLFMACKWNQKPINCCQYFLPIQTEIGLCFGINSWQTVDNLQHPEVPRLTASYKQEKELPVLQFFITSTSQIYIYSTETIPDIQLPDYESKISVGHSREFSFVKREVVNEDEVRGVPIKTRNCRYLDENYLTVQKYYSHSGCIVEERKKAHMRFCNCTHHLMPNAEKVCDLEGMLCLYKFMDEVTVYKPIWSHAPGLSIDCQPACDEDDIDLLIIKKGFTRNVSYADVVVKMAYFPSERFKRVVVRDKLDLAVSVGGSLGLFIGVSVLSVVEVFYYFCMRIWQKSPDEIDEETGP